MSETKPAKVTRLERETTEGGAEVAILTLTNPPLNLFDQAMFDSLVADLAELAARPPRAVLLRAEGRVVSGGEDVHVFDGLTVEQGGNCGARCSRRSSTRSRRCRVR